MEEGLLGVVVALEPLLVVDQFVKLVLLPLGRVQATELSRAPHVVGVELVGAAELVPVLLSVNTLIEGVACLEAQVLVPAEIGHVAGVLNSHVPNRGGHLLFV